MIKAVGTKGYVGVLMDIQMSEMDVLTATAATRKLDGPARDLPIIALTANVKKDERETYISGGMNDYVTKPIEPDNLATALSRLCGIEIGTGALLMKTGPPTTGVTVADTVEALSYLLDDMDIAD